MEENQKKESFRKKAELLLHHLKPAASAFALGIGASLAATLLRTLFTQIIRFTVDHALLGETEGLPTFLLNAPAGQILVWCAAAAAAVALLEFGAGFVQDSNLPKGSERFVKSLRDALYGHIQRLPYRWHVQNPTGDIIQRCTSDVDVIRQFVCNQLVEVVRTVFLIVLYLCIMFTMNLRLSLISALFIPIVGLSSGVFYKKISGRFQAADEAEGDLTTCAQENLTAVRVVRAFGRERYEEEKFNGKNQRFSQLWIRLGKLLSVYWASGTLLTCLQVMVIVVAGACECVAGRMTLGSFVAFVTYNEALAWPVRSLGRVLSDMSKAGVSMDRVGYILNAREERDLPDAVDAVNGDIVFNHVSFAYDGQPVLEDVSFTIHQGETFAILGGTGSGKSTILSLICRNYEFQKGQILIDGIDIRKIRISSLRRHFGQMLQDVFLFSGTIRSNIVLREEGIPDSEIMEVCRYVNADKFINKLDHGLDEEVRERGNNFSAGQRQLLSFARTIIHKPSVMILDEATANIDTETELLIQDSLEKMRTVGTMLIVAHRLSTIQHADNIIVLSHGKILEQGTHQQLLARHGRYYQLYTLQYHKAQLNAAE